VSEQLSVYSIVVHLYLACVQNIQHDENTLCSEYLQHFIHLQTFIFFVKVDFKIKHLDFFSSSKKLQDVLVRLQKIEHNIFITTFLFYQVHQ